MYDRNYSVSIRIELQECENVNIHIHTLHPQQQQQNPPAIYLILLIVLVIIPQSYTQLIDKKRKAKKTLRTSPMPLAIREKGDKLTIAAN